MRVGRRRRRSSASERVEASADRKRPHKRPQERRSASRQGCSIPPVGSIAGDSEDGGGNDALWKPQNGFHRDLEISHRTRDSHIPTSRSVVRLTRETNGEPTTDNDIEPPSPSSCPWWPVLRCRSVDSGQPLTKKAHSNPRRPVFLVILRALTLVFLVCFVAKPSL